MTKGMQTLRALLILLLLVTLGGCGYLFGDRGVFRDQSEDYKKSPELPVVAVPAGKDATALQEIYPIPPVANELVLAGEFEVPRPVPLTSGAADELVRIQKLGDQSWALVGTAPGQVWPQVRGFLSAAGMPVARLDARAGLIETGWLELEDQPMASRFQFRIEQGVQRGTSELHVLQMAQAGDLQSWPGQSTDSVLEADMLRAIAQYIANSTEAAPVSMVAEQAISATGKISLQESDAGYTFIELALPFDRAWASLARALEKSTFEITDRNRQTGSYYARFNGVESEQESGWFSWLWRRGSKDDPLAGEDFLVSVTASSDNQVAIRLQAENPAAKFGRREEQSLLTLIKGNIN